MLAASFPQHSQLLKTIWRARAKGLPVNKARCGKQTQGLADKSSLVTRVEAWTHEHLKLLLC